MSFDDSTRKFTLNNILDYNHESDPDHTRHNESINSMDHQIQDIIESKVNINNATSFNVQHQNLFPNLQKSYRMNNVDDHFVHKTSKRIPNYFWIVNTHTNKNSKKKNNNLNGHCSQFEIIKPSDKLEEKIRQDEVEKKLLIKDLVERVPDPMKLIILGQKMDQVTEKIENLDENIGSSISYKNFIKKEKNRLASKCCRLKKKAMFEANLIIYKGLRLEKNTFLKMNQMIDKTISNYLDAKKFQSQTPMDGSLLQQVTHIMDTFKSQCVSVHMRANDFVQDLLNRTHFELNKSNLDNVGHDKK